MLRYIFFGIIFLPHILFANSGDLDDYIKKFNEGNLDDKIDVFSELYNTLDRNYPDSAFYYIDIFQKEGIEENRDDVLAFSSYYFANYLMNKSFFEEAIEKLENAEKFFRLEENDTVLAEIYNAYGNLYYMQGEFERAEENYLKSTISGKKSGIPKFEYFSQINLVRTLSSLGRKEDAIETLNSFLDFYKQKNDARNLANGYGLKGQIALDSGNVEKAIEYYERSLEYNLSEGSNSLIANGYNNMAIACFYKDDLEKAEQYFKLALKYREKTKNEYFITESYYNLASLYFMTQDYENAEIYFKKTYDLSVKAGLKNAKGDAILGLSEVYRELGMHKERADLLFEKVELDEEIYKTETSKELNLLRVHFENQKNTIKQKAQKRENALENKLSSVESSWTFWIWIFVSCLVVVIMLLFIRLKVLKN